MIGRERRWRTWKKKLWSEWLGTTGKGKREDEESEGEGKGTEMRQWILDSKDTTCAPHLPYHSSSSQRHLLGDHTSTISCVPTRGQHKTLPVTPSPCSTKWPRCAIPNTRFCCRILILHPRLTIFWYHHTLGIAQTQPSPHSDLSKLATPLSDSTKFSLPAFISASRLSSLFAYNPRNKVHGYTHLKFSFVLPNMLCAL